MPHVPENVEQRLKDKLRDLIGRDERLQKHLANEEGRTVDQLEDWMHLLENDDVVTELDEHAHELARKIIAALGRLENGTYGYSVQSGEEIEAERLEAIPWAALTVDEQKRAERSGEQWTPSQGAVTE